MKQYVFLTYLNRSGSTFLASRLDEYTDIGVSLEASIPDGIVYGTLKIEGHQDVDKLLEKLYADEKFISWNIDKTILRNKLLKLRYPYGFSDLLKIILGEYFRNSKAKIFIHKCGHYIMHIKTIRNLFHDAKFIFVLRDIRAVYNSQKKSIDSRTKKPMANNPVVTAMRFLKVASIVDMYIQSDWFHIVKYEDLICNIESEINSLLAFLGANTEKKDDIISYYNRIHANQKHLHANLNLELIKERTNAWQYELSSLEITIIQKIAGHALVKYGYELVDYKKLSFKEQIYFMLCWLRYYNLKFNR